MDNINDLKIRKAKIADYSAVNDLYHVIYDMYHKLFPLFYKKQPQKTLREGTFLNMLDDKQGFVIVAEINKNVVGVLCATIEKDDADEWVFARKRMRIDEIAVLLEYSRKGIGKKLIQEAEKWAKKKKIHDLILFAYALNEDAIQFHKANGYESYTIELTKKI